MIDEKCENIHIILFYLLFIPLNYSIYNQTWINFPQDFQTLGKNIFQNIQNNVIGLIIRCLSPIFFFQFNHIFVSILKCIYLGTNKEEISTFIPGSVTGGQYQHTIWWTFLICMSSAVQIKNLFINISWISSLYVLFPES